MDPSRKRDSRHLGQKTLCMHHMLPISRIEIPASVLPSSTSVSGLIVADSYCPQVMPGDPARGSGCDTAVAAAPLRVLLLPPASTLPCDTSPSRPQDMIHRLLLLVQPGTDEKAARGAASTEVGEDSLASTSVLPLARQARLARELLAVGYQIAGVWLRIDEGEDSFQQCINRVLHHHVRHQQHSFITSVTNAVVKANAWTPQILLAPKKKPAGFCCCFVFFSSRATSGLVTNSEEAPTTLGYYCSGSSVASLVVRRLPVVVRQAGNLQPAVPWMRSMVYSTFFPLQMELRFVPSKSVVYYVQACGKQLSAALASQLYVRFASVLCPPILASLVIADSLPALPSSQTAPCSSAPGACGKGAGSTFETDVCNESPTSLNEEAQVHRTRKMPKQVAGKPCYPLGNSACPLHRGSTWIPPPKRRDQHSSPDFFVNTSGEVARYCGSTFLLGLSETAWDGLNGEENFKNACSCRSSLCFLQPLLAGDLVSRYEVSLDMTPEPSDQCGTDLPVPVCVKFRVVSCDDTSADTRDVAVSDPLTVQEPEGSASGLSSLRSPVILSVKGEFVAAVVASIDASVEHLRKLLAADAAAAVARRIADRVADVCAANFHSEWQPRKPNPYNRRSDEQQGQQSVSGSVAPLEVRRFYMVNMAEALRGGKQKYDDSASTLLVSDFSNPEDTPDDAAEAAAERLEFLLGVPTAAVAPHNLLKDGGAAAVLRVNDMRNHRIEAHEMGCWHQETDVVTRMQQNSALAPFEGRSRRAAVFWDNLEARASKEMPERSQAHGGETSAYRGRDTRSVLLWASLVLVVVTVVTYMLFPSAARIDQRYNP